MENGKEENDGHRWKSLEAPRPCPLREIQTLREVSLSPAAGSRRAYPEESELGKN